MAFCGFLKSEWFWCPLAYCPHTFGAISRGHTVTLGLTLLCGGRPQGLGALAGWLASVAGAAHRALLLAEAALRGALRRETEPPRHRATAPALTVVPQGAPTYLAPLAGHPAGRRTATQVATHGGGRLG
jgi:hypothetical protein